jgi:hypothetical protein
VKKLNCLVPIETVTNEIPKNAPSFTNSTSLGMSIDVRAVYENTPDSIRFSSESLSNETDVSSAQDEKHDSPRILTLRGIAIDLREQYANASRSMNLRCELSSNEIDCSE